VITHERPRSRILDGQITDTGRPPHGSVVIGYRLVECPARWQGEHLIDELWDNYQRPASGADLPSVEFLHELMPWGIDAQGLELRHPTSVFR
jgi:hypothetical protein